MHAQICAWRSMHECTSQKDDGHAQSTLDQPQTHARNVWERWWIRRREGRGVYSKLLRELDAENPEMFRRYHIVDRKSIRMNLAMVSLPGREWKMWHSSEK